MDAIEGSNEIKTSVGRQTVGLRVVEREIFHARPHFIFLGSGESMLGNIIAVKLGLRKGFRHLKESNTGTTTDICRLRPGLQLSHDPVEFRQHLRNEGKTIPIAENPLDAARALGTTCIVVQPDTGPECLW